MKIYRCDQCSEEFDSKDGMIEGHYEHSRKIILKESIDPTGWHTGTIKDVSYKVKKTIDLYKPTPGGGNLPPTTPVAKKDLCPRCVKLLEKP